MQRCAHLHRVPLGRISFKGALDTVCHWSAVIAAAGERPRKQDKLINQMLAAMARDPVPERPHRSEPRARKRRPQKLPVTDQAEASNGEPTTPQSPASGTS